MFYRYFSHFFSNLAKKKPHTFQCLSLDIMPRPYHFLSNRVLLYLQAPRDGPSFSYFIWIALPTFLPQGAVLTCYTVLCPDSLYSPAGAIITSLCPFFTPYLSCCLLYLELYDCSTHFCAIKSFLIEPVTTSSVPQSNHQTKIDHAGDREVAHWLRVQNCSSRGPKFGY